MEQIINDLSIRFSRMKTYEERMDVLRQIGTGDYPPLVRYRIERDLVQSGKSTISREARNEDEDRKFIDALNEMSVEHGFEDAYLDFTVENMSRGILHDEDPWSGPLLGIPCANINPQSRNKCENPGLQACTGCRLVSYCSSACQSTHWRKHKKDCKNELNSPDWMPHWIMENRDPDFVSTDSSAPATGSTPARGNLNLWGTMPAINILSLEQNEGVAYKQDLSLCFTASEDLRDVILSINSIPRNYPGHLSVLINDSSPRIAARNLITLLAIATGKDTSLAADLALHLWYSAFIPEGYHWRLGTAILPTLPGMKDRHIDWKSGKLRVVSDLTPAVEIQFIGCLEAQQMQTEPIDPKVAAKSYSSVALSPDRVDSRDNYISRLKPAHRVSITKYQSNGLLLPFGAANSPFDTPNITLFTEKGEWLLQPTASPLAGWDLSAVISTGKAHGAREEDLFGCLYFYLREQLIKFKKQIKKLAITFYLCNMDSQELSNGIRSNEPPADTSESRPYSYPPGLPTSFDRIHVSNTVEQGYLGYGRVLADWASLLNDSNPSATLLSYTKHWMVDHPYERDQKITRENMLNFVIGKGHLIPTLKEKKFPHVVRPEVFSVASLAWGWAEDSMYDDSVEFDKYLEKQRLGEAMKSCGVRMKRVNTIMPKRHGIPLSAPLSTLPIYKDDEHWYTEVFLSRQGFKTRFQEFSRSNV